MIGPITAKQIRDALLETVIHTGWTDGMRIPPAKRTVAYSRVDESGSGIEEADDAVGEFTLTSGERFELIVRPLEAEDHIGSGSGATYTHDFSRRDYVGGGLGLGGGLAKMGNAFASVDEDREEMPPPPFCPKCGSIQGRGTSWRYLGEDHGVPMWEHKCPIAGPQVGHMSVGMSIRVVSPPGFPPPPPEVLFDLKDIPVKALVNPDTMEPDFDPPGVAHSVMEQYRKYIHAKDERGEPYLSLHDWLERRGANMDKLMSGGYITETEDFTKEDYERLLDRAKAKAKAEGSGSGMEIGEDID
jgi:hypothetical protein